MYCEKIDLKDFRNYRRLELGLPRGLVVFQGENAAGKTSLLEAIYLLATTKSPRARTEQELVNLETAPEYGAPAFTRLSAVIERKEGEIAAEILIIRDGDTPDRERTSGIASRKRVKLNGVPRRAIDLIGQINVVLFSPEDLDLIIGTPALRRRYLDITLSQTDHRYLRTLQEYARVLAQRNGFLRNLKERQRNNRGAAAAGRNEMTIWDEELIKGGTYIIRRRQECLAGLNERAAGLHAHLIGLDSELQPGFELVYRPSFGLDGEVQDEAGLTRRFQAQLEKLRPQELQRGVSLAGPHRDDFAFMVDGADIGVYGSRGQQRTAVLALKLAEVGWMEKQTGDQPILMLDDILSELDVQRRQYVLDTVQAGAEQVLITSTDLALFGDMSQLQERASLFRVEGGKVNRL